MLELDSSPFSTLSPEIEEHIIDQLSGCVPALRCCALTCRAWLPRCRFHLLSSVRIKSGRQLEEFADMLNTYPTRRSWIDSVTMAPDAEESNPRSLMETFPAILLAKVSNLRRWEINQASSQSVEERATLFFHNVTSTRLRYSSIQELHLCSVQIGSYAELIRLLMAFGQLGSLKCTNLTFSRVDVPGIDSLKIRARRRLVKLSSLTVWDMEPTAISLLLEILQDALANLDILHIKGTKWDAIPLPKADSLPVLSKLLSVTLHWRNKQGRGLHEYLAGVFVNASGLVAGRLGGGSNLRSIAIQLHLDESIRQQQQPIMRSHIAALGHTLESMKQQCLRLEQVLADLHLKQYLVSLHLPSHWTGTDTILRIRLKENFPGLHEKGLLTTVINGGTHQDGMSTGHEKAVIAAVASPDAKWIASGSEDGSIILWDVEHPGRIADRFRGFVDSSQSVSFSPDSYRIAFPADAHTITISRAHTFHVRHFNARGEGSTLHAVLPIPPGNRHSCPARHCAWSRDGSMLSTVVFSGGTSVDARVWEATTYALLYTFTDIPTPERSLRSGIPPLPLVNCILDDDELVVARLRDMSLDEVGAVPPTALQSCPIRNVTTGKRLTMSKRPATVKRVSWAPTVTERFTTAQRLTAIDQRDPRKSCSIMVIGDRRQLAAHCGGSVRDWELSNRYPAFWMSSLSEGPAFPLSPDGRQKLSWRNSWFKITDTDAGRCVATLTFHCADIVDGCFSPDGRYIAICSEKDTEGLVQVRAVSDGVLLGSFRYECRPEGSKNPRNPVVVFSGDGRAVFLGTAFGRVHIHSLPLPQPNAT